MNDVVIFGTGALATRIGWHLARGGTDVTLVGTWRDALDVIDAEGLALEVDGELQHAPAASAQLGEPVGPASLVLVLVKSHQTVAIAPHVIRAAAPGGLVLTLQNGLGNHEVLQEAALQMSTAALDAITIGAGVTSLGAMSTGPGRARAGGPGATVLGAAPDMLPGPRGVLEAFAKALSGEGLDVSIEPDLDALVWRKLSVNCAINPLSAILGLPNGRLLEADDSHTTLRAAAEEVASVAAALGVNAGTPQDLADLAETVARNTAENRSSMLQDVERDAPTEIDALCGAVVRHGAEHGIETPVNLRLWRDIIALEDRGVSSTAADAANGMLASAFAEYF